jgi:hypothetical protein
MSALITPPWLIHLGVQKTGSKALQRFVVGRQAALEAAGLYYPRTGRGGAQNSLHLPLFQALTSGQTDLLASLNTEFQSSGLAQALLSYEGFSLLPDEAIRALRTQLGEARIVLVMRRQDDWLSSWYNQLVKAHKVSITRIEAFERSMLDYNEECDYARTLTRWAEHFGPQALVPLVYERGISIVEQFFRVLNIALPEAVMTQASDNANPALNAAGMAMLREVKRIVGASPKLPEVVEAFHRQRREYFVDTHLSGSLNILSAAQREQFLQRYEMSNETVRQRYFPQRERLFAPQQVFTALDLDESAGREAAQEFLHQLGWLG